MDSSKDVVLFAVVGMSPAVLTETVWALAHEREPVIPDRVVVLTTVTARDQIVRQLFEQDTDQTCGWERLKTALSHQGFNLDGKLKFGNTGDSIRVFTNADGSRELADIATSEDNAAASDFMLRHLREFTANPSTAVIASIAGGRKTMSALMISCMSLLGREHDRVCHVLVNPPFDSPLTPPFLFPVKGAKHLDRGGKSHNAASANIELTYVPYVRMLGWYQEKFKVQPPGYSALVAGVQRQVPKVYPLITLDMKAGRVLIDGKKEVNITPAELPVLYLFSQGVCEIGDITRQLIHFQNDLESDFSTPWFDDFQEWERLSNVEQDDEKDVTAKQKKIVSRVISSLRAKLSAVIDNAALNELLTLRGVKPSYPEKQICIKGKNPLAASQG